MIPPPVIFRLAAALFMVVPFQLGAEIVVMRDGTVHRGSVVKQDAGSMEVRTKEGTVELEKPFIYRIFYDEAQFKIFEQREGPRLAEMRACPRPGRRNSMIPRRNTRRLSRQSGLNTSGLSPN